MNVYSVCQQKVTNAQTVHIWFQKAYIMRCMTIDEYFGDWMRVLDREETMKIMGWLRKVNPNTLCPALPNVFRAFKLCPYDKCRVVFIGQD